MTVPHPILCCVRAPEGSLWVDYLRSFITVLVVAHHSTLAYTTFSRTNQQAYILSTHPIIDSKRWIGLDIFENFNDVFFMALMFLIGGFFVVKGLKKKGSWFVYTRPVLPAFFTFCCGGEQFDVAGLLSRLSERTSGRRIKEFLPGFFFRGRMATRAALVYLGTFFIQSNICHF